MKQKVLVLICLLCTVFTGAWAQTTVIARMQDLVSAASTNTATVSSEWRASEGDVYEFSDNHFIGGITNSSVLSAMEGDQYVTVAMYVYGNSLRGCPFGYGDSQDGLKFVFASNSNFTANTYGTTVRMTTKGVADFTSADLGSMSANAWNLVAISFPGKSNSYASQSRYISPAGHYTAHQTTSTMTNPATSSKKFAIGSGDQGTAREAFYGMIANVTVMTSSSLLSKDDIQAKMGAAPQNGSNDYAIGFTNTTHTKTGRQISAIRLGDQEISIDGAGNVYQDLTETASFTINAGEDVKPAIVWNGAWMDGYVYVDTDSSDKQFTVGEMVSSATGHDASPNSLLNNFGTFHIDNAGDYRMRYKVEWEHTDPTGNGGNLIENGGYVLDVMLHVVDPGTMIDASFTYQSTSGASWTVNKSIAEGTILNIGDYDNFDFYQNFAFADGTDTEVSESNKQFVINCEDNFPFEVGKLTRLQSKGTGNTGKDYKAGEHNSAVVFNKTAQGGDVANNNIWVFAHVPGSPNLFTLRNFGTNGYFTIQDPSTRINNWSNHVQVITKESPIAWTEGTGTTSYIRIIPNTNANAQNKGFNMCHPGNEHYACGTHLNYSSGSTTLVSASTTGSGDVGYYKFGNDDYKANDQSCNIAVTLNSFTVTLNPVPGDGFYGTIYLPFNMEVPAYVGVYAATANNSSLNLTQVEGVVPAGAYVLYESYPCGENEDKESVELEASNETPTTVEHNDLTGSITVGELLPSGKNYVLNRVDGVMGFYKYSKATYPTAKAVYCAGETSPVNGFTFEFGEDPIVTAIQQLQQEHMAGATIYDLQGRRIQNAVKGLNIVNGKKVIR